MCTSGVVGFNHWSGGSFFHGYPSCGWKRVAGRGDVAVEVSLQRWRIQHLFVVQRSRQDVMMSYPINPFFCFLLAFWWNVILWWNDIQLDTSRRPYVDLEDASVKQFPSPRDLVANVPNGWLMRGNRVSVCCNLLVTTSQWLWWLRQAPGIFFMDSWLCLKILGKAFGLSIVIICGFSKIPKWPICFFPVYPKLSPILKVGKPPEYLPIIMPASRVRKWRVGASSRPRWRSCHFYVQIVVSAGRERSNSAQITVEV